jgi:hypothetical protein
VTCDKYTFFRYEPTSAPLAPLTRHTKFPAGCRGGATNYYAADVSVQFREFNTHVVVGKGFYSYSFLPSNAGRPPLNLCVGVATLSTSG